MSAKIITLKEICKSAKVDPKIARSRLRRAIPKDKAVKPIRPERWEWPISKRALITKYVSD